MNKLQLVLVSLGMVSLTSGCGGGGGSPTPTSGGMPTAAVKITPANANAVAKGAVGPAQTMAKSGSSLSGVIGAVVKPSRHSRSVLDISLAEFARARSLQLLPVVTGAIASQTINCTTSGTMTFSYQDAGVIDTFDAGDTMTMAFNSCVEAGSTSNGSMSFAVNNLSGGSVGTPAAPVTASFTMTFANYSSVTTSENISMNGNMTISTSDNGDTTTGLMSGSSFDMTSSIDGQFQMTDYAFNFSDTLSTGAYSYAVQMTTASVVLDGVITITTPTPFSGVGAGNPTAGVMVVTGASNSTLTLTAHSDGSTVGVVVDEDGSGPQASQTLPDTTWAAI